MLQKYTHSNSKGRAKGIYILVGISLPVAISSIVLAWAEGDLKSASTYAIMSLSWSAFALYSAWKLTNRQQPDNKHYANKGATRRKRLFEKIISWIILPFAIAWLIGVIIYGPHLYFALRAIWWIIISAGQLFYVSITS